MKRALVIASGVAVLLPALSLAQPSPSGAVPSPGTVWGNTARPLPVDPCQAQLQFTWRGRNFDRFRGPPFSYPRGFRYRRWRTGNRLPHEFMSPRFRFNNWQRLGVGPPGAGRRWIRYGPDLLLVNIHTRRIEDVIFNVFF
jgi:Ni/Co efflux regulator RcnB